MAGLRVLIVAVGVLSMASPLMAQVSAPVSLPAPVLVHPVPSPATKLEGFRPYPGAVVTHGLEELGRISTGRVVVEMRHVMDSFGNGANGVVIHLAHGDRKQWAFVDGDELPALLKGINAVLNVDANPTSLKHFDVRYTTRDGLSFIAYSNVTGGIEYSLQSGDPVPLAILNITAAEMVILRDWLELAMKRLT